MALKNEIADLKKQLASRQPVVETVDKPVLTKSQTKMLDSIDAILHVTGEQVAKINGLWNEVVESATAMRIAIYAMTKPVLKVQPPPLALAAHLKDQIDRMPLTRTLPPPLTYVEGDNGKLGKCERAVLTVLAQYPEGKHKNQVAVISGYSSNSGSLDTNLSKLRTKGYITRDNPMRITNDGKAALGHWEPLPTGPALVQYWLNSNQIGPCAKAILRVLFECHPSGMIKEELVKATNYSGTSGSFDTSLSRLRTLELVTRDKPMKAAEVFFQ